MSHNKADKDWTIQHSLDAYAGIRRHGRLQRMTWYEQFGQTPTQARACALGAFFLGGRQDAYDRGCANDILPEWMIEVTPDLFDCMQDKKAFAWADLVFAPEGLVDRANRLPLKKRKAMWEDAEQRIIKDIKGCSAIRVPIDYKNIDSVLNFAKLRDCERTAGTIVECMDEALMAAGV